MNIVFNSGGPIMEIKTTKTMNKNSFGIISGKGDKGSHLEGKLIMKTDHDVVLLDGQECPFPLNETYNVIELDDKYTMTIEVNRKD